MGKGVVLDQGYANQIAAIRIEHINKLLFIYWNPADVRRGALVEKLKGDPFRPKVPLRDRIVEVDAHRARIKAFKQAENQAAMQKFRKGPFEQWLKEQTKIAEAMDALFREFNKEDTLDILCRLKDEEPLNRWMAIQITMYRWEKLENFLVELLDDPAPMVRQAAHQALVHLSRGSDFGPAGPNPNTTQIRNAQKLWRAYLELQARG